LLDQLPCAIRFIIQFLVPVGKSWTGAFQLLSAKTHIMLPSAGAGHTKNERKVPDSLLVSAIPLSQNARQLVEAAVGEHRQAAGIDAAVSLIVASQHDIVPLVRQSGLLDHSDLMACGEFESVIGAYRNPNAPAHQPAST